MKTIRKPGKNVHGKVAPEKRHTLRRWLVGSAALVLLLLWWLWPTSQLAKVRQMQEALFSVPRDELSPEERKQQFEALRAERDKLSPAEREELGKERARQVQQKMNAEASKYLAMSPPERQQAIDKRIAREEKRAEGGGKGGPGFAAGPGGAGTPRGPATPEERDAKRREMLINLTPMARAGMDQMRLDNAKRRADLGLPIRTGPGGR